MHVRSSAHMCDFVCGWMHMCFYKKEKKVPVILVCGSPQLTLSSCLVLIFYSPKRKGRKREKDKEVNEEDKDRSKFAEMMQKKSVVTNLTSKVSSAFRKTLQKLIYFRPRHEMRKKINTFLIHLVTYLQNTSQNNCRNTSEHF